MTYSLVYVAGIIAFEMTEEGKLVIWFDGAGPAKRRSKSQRAKKRKRLQSVL